jgi:hypothetical protein
MDLAHDMSSKTFKVNGIIAKPIFAAPERQARVVSYMPNRITILKLIVSQTPTIY